MSVQSALESLVPLAASGPDAATSSRLADLARQADALSAEVHKLAEAAKPLATTLGAGERRLDIFHGYMGVFVAAFLVALFATPIMRKLAIANGIIDRPSVARKIHRVPVAYLGGVAVYLGILGGVVFALTSPFHNLIDFHVSARSGAELPMKAILAVLAGMTAIMLCGLIDDVVGIDPRAKIAGQLFAAAALATQDVGVKVAAGLVVPIAKALGIGTTVVGGFETVLFQLPLPIEIGGYGSLTVDVVYWIGTAIIAVFVIGACNASNLVDGLDGLLSGVTAIATAGLLFIALTLAMMDDGALDATRLVLCLALLGACLGFLPHNFNPATIFLGDAGSLMLGYTTVVIILMLGDTGRTSLVFAGLIIYAIPIIDTTLAIVRRKISGKKISDADDQHLHHMLKRALGVKGAVFALYAIGTGFAALGIGLSIGRGRVTYALTLIFAAFIGVTSFKVARRTHHEKQATEMAASGRGKSERDSADSAPLPGLGGANGNGNGAHAAKGAPVEIEPPPRPARQGDVPAT